MLQYWSDHSDSYDFVIADSSKDAIKRENSRSVQKYLPTASVVKGEPKEHPYFKIHRALRAVKTEFLLWATDDDFVLKNALRKVLDTIKARPHVDFVSCNHIGFRTGDSGVHFEGIYYNYPYQGLTASQRLKVWPGLMNAAPFFYSLHRTKFWKRVSDFVVDNGLVLGSGLHQGNFLEHLPYALCLALGRFEVSKVVLCARSLEAPSVWKPQRKNIFEKFHYHIMSRYYKNLILNQLFQRLESANSDEFRSADGISQKASVILALRSKIYHGGRDVVNVVTEPDFDVADVERDQLFLDIFHRDSRDIEEFILTP